MARRMRGCACRYAARAIRYSPHCLLTSCVLPSDCLTLPHNQRQQRLRDDNGASPEPEKKRTPVKWTWALLRATFNAFDPAYWEVGGCC